MARELRVWSPTRELERFSRDFDELFTRFLGSSETTFAAPPIESFIEGGRLIVRADLPGVDPKDVDVTVTGNILRIKGSRHYEHEDKGRDFLRREVRYGSFERSLTLPTGVDADQIRASYRNGVLELTVPIPASVGARKVPVEIAPSIKKG
jgi:HSP20 family protein